VVRRGDRADRFFIITRGEAQVVLERPDGAPVQVATLRAGEYFGEIALLRGGRRTATVRAADSGLDVWPRRATARAASADRRPETVDCA
jgi:CRP-like cAMP-binding protein